MKAKILILPLVVIALLFVSCDKEPAAEPSTSATAPDTTASQYPVEYWEWCHNPSSGFTIDTAWDGDTVLCF